MKKILSSVAAIAAASALSVSVSAADWSQTSYADNDPATYKAVSTSADGVVFTGTADGVMAKARLTMDKILKNPDDIANVYQITWDVTYTGMDYFDGSDMGWIGGACWAGTGNSVGYSAGPNYVPVTDDEGNETGETKVDWDNVVTMQDSVKYLLPSSKPSIDSEMVWMQWDQDATKLATSGVTLTISNLHIYDKDGNEIEQLGYGEAGAAAEEVVEEAVAEVEAAVEEAVVEAVAEAIVEEAVEEAVAEAIVEEAVAEVVEEAVAEEAPVVVEAAPVVVETTPVASTGNTTVAAIAAVMAVAGAAAVVSKRK